MNILLSGSTGLVGRAILPALDLHHAVTALVRRAPCGPREVTWDATSDRWDLPGNVEAVVHLAGENIAAGRWTESRKAALWDSRVLGTRYLVQKLLRQSTPPKVVLSASAVGYYGACGADVVTEESPAGTDFLGRMAEAWERELLPLEAAHVRVVKLRFGVILSRQGGALAKMLPLFRIGLGSPLGSGTQWMSWIAIQDVVEAILFCLRHDTAAGPLNIVAPQPVTNREFTALLAAAVHRPVMPAVPAFVLRLLLGEMADAALLSSVRAHPARLQALGFQFQYPELGRAFAAVLQPP